ncbi:MAG: hypothetical protein JXA13_05860 [Anaerolineales bacterium]|nr:hypothetical protein [Anaerolineales bacterium]
MQIQRCSPAGAAAIPPGQSGSGQAGVCGPVRLVLPGGLHAGPERRVKDMAAVPGRPAPAHERQAGRSLPGGLYGVTRCEVENPWEDIPAAWKTLVAWRENSKYGHGAHQWLEEHLTIPGAGKSFVLDLFLTVSEWRLPPAGLSQPDNQ